MSRPTESPHPSTPAPAPSVAIVVLNWNGREDTLRCLASLHDHAPGAALVVVDNGSTDDSVDAIRRAYPGVEIIETRENLGYAGGNNRGITWALDSGFEIVGVLNNDTVVEPSWLEPLVEEILADPARVAATPVINYLDNDRIWFAGSRLDEHRGIYVHATMAEAPAEDVETPAITGCAIVAHRTLWERVGLFDERYFLIFEDAEWSHRAVDAGCRMLVVSRSTIRHAVSASFTGSGSSIGTYYYARNGLRYLRTTGRTRAQQRHFVAFCIREALRSVRTARSAALPELSYTSRGLLDGLRGRGGQMSEAAGPPSALEHTDVGPIRARPRETPADRDSPATSARPPGSGTRSIDTTRQRQRPSRRC